MDEFRKLVGEFNGRLARLYQKLKAPPRGAPSFTDERPWVRPPKPSAPITEEERREWEKLRDTKMGGHSGMGE